MRESQYFGHSSDQREKENFVRTCLHGELLRKLLTSSHTNLDHNSPYCS